MRILILRILRGWACGLAAFVILQPVSASAQDGAGRSPAFDKPSWARRLFDPPSWRGNAPASPGRFLRTQDAPAISPTQAAPIDPRLQRVMQDPTADAGAPSLPSAAPPVGDPAGAGTSPGVPDLAVPAADRNIGGGEPTEETAATDAAEDEAADENAPKHLQDLLGFEESPIKIYGWLQNSYTGNTNGRGKAGENFGVNPNHKADWWMGNQYYIVAEKVVEQNDTINFGFRMDNMFGHDWQFNYEQGFLNGSFPLNHMGYDIPQLYGEVHLPFLTEGGIDVKAGKWYTIAGYEQVPAIARPLLSVPYMFNYGQPFTHVGALTTWHLTDKINLYNGAINGWDRFINERYAWGYIGGFSWVSQDDKTTLAFTAVWGPNQYPSFLPSNQQIYPGGYVNIPSLAGLRNPGYWRNDRTLFTTVGTHKWSDKLTQVVETDQGWERAIPGLGSGGANGAPRSATWFSFGNWFLYEFDPKLTGVWRSEVFWDPQGARTQQVVNGQFVGDRFYEMTVGMIYKPIPNLWIRPEARYDWSQYHPAYTDGTRKSQFTLAVDAIILW